LSKAVLKWKYIQLNFVRDFKI